MICTRNSSMTAIGILAAWLTAAGAAGAAPFLHVPTTGEPGRIEIVDVAADRVVTQLEGFTEAHGLAGTPNGRLLVIGSLAEHVQGDGVDRPAGVSATDHAAHHGGGGAAGSAAPAAISTLSVIDVTTGEVVRRIDVPGAVHHVALSPDGRFAVATHPGAASVSVVDLDSYAVVATVPTGATPNYAAFSPDGAALYVSVAGEDRIAFVDTATWKVEGTLGVGASPEHLVLSPDGARLYVNNVDGGSISVVELASRRVVETYELGAALHGIDVTDGGEALIVSVVGNEEVARIDLATGAVERAALEPSPYHVAAVPGTGKVYVSSSAQSGLTVLRQQDLSIIGRIETSGIGHRMVAGSIAPAIEGVVK